MKTIICKCLWLFAGIGAIAVGIYMDVSFLYAFFTRWNAIDMNMFEWFVSIWLGTVPTMIGIDFLRQVYARVKSKKGEVAA